MKKDLRRGINLDLKFRIRRLKVSPSCARPKQSYSAVTERFRTKVIMSV